MSYYKEKLPTLELNCIYLSISLLNTKQLNNTPAMIPSIIINDKIDILCLIETWMNNDNSDPTYIAAIPNTHYVIQRYIKSHGCGLAAIINSNIKLINHSNRTFN